MTKTITLPRSVVERALEAFTRGCPPDCKDGMTDSGGVYPWGEAALIPCPACQAVDELRAALEQPQDPREQHLNMVPAGWQLVPVEPNDKLHLFLVGAYKSQRLDHWKSILNAAPQPPVVEQPQGEQEPVAWIVNIGGGIGYNPYHDAAGKLPDGVRFDLYTHPQNLNCKSTQARLATLWGYEKPQPPSQPLTEDEIKQAFLTTGLFEPGDEVIGYEVEMARAIERAHGIGGEA